MTVLSVRMAPTDKLLLEELAAREGVTVSDVVRDVLTTTARARLTARLAAALAAPTPPSAEA